MKVIATIALITMIANSLLAAQKVGSNTCLSPNCAYCSKNGDNQVCEQCFMTPMAGAGDSRKCSNSQGITIAGCLIYQSSDNTEQGEVYCSECDHKRGFQLFPGATKVQNRCKRCNPRTSYWSGTTCVLATPVEGCRFYKYDSDGCSVYFKG